MLKRSYKKKSVTKRIVILALIVSLKFEWILLEICHFLTFAGVYFCNRYQMLEGETYKRKRVYLRLGIYWRKYSFRCSLLGHLYSEYLHPWCTVKHCSLCTDTTVEGIEIRDAGHGIGEGS